MNKTLVLGVIVMITLGTAALVVLSAQASYAVRLALELDNPVTTTIAQQQSANASL